MEKTVFQSKPLKSIGFIVLILFIFSLTLWFFVGTAKQIKEIHYIGQESAARNVLTVSGEGIVYVKPDVARVSFSVTNESKDLAQAESINAQKMNAVIDAIKGQGVKEKDIKTTSYTLYPRYEFGTSIPCMAGLPCPPDNKRTLGGYEVTQSVEITIRDITKISGIVGAALGAGANQAGDLQFTVDDMEKAKSQARAIAIAQAKAKAKDLASQLGVSLQGVTSFTENGSQPFPIPYLAESKVAVPTEPTVNPTIESGESKVQVTVTINYEID